MSEELIKRLRADNASLLSQVKISDEQWDAWNDRIEELEADIQQWKVDCNELVLENAALIAAGDKLAGFAGHDEGCDALVWDWVSCSCGYTYARKAWAEARGDD